MRRSDWAWPLGFLLVGVLELSSMARSVGVAESNLISADSAAAGIAVEALACFMLVFRRRWPVAVALAVGIVCGGLPLIGIHMDEPATPILIIGLGMFGAGRYRDDLWGLVAVAGVTVVPFIAKSVDDPGQVDGTDALFILLIVGTPYAFGRLVQRQAAAHVREQERIRREAITAERVRIARELHDVLAHSISSMVIQANIGADAASGSPSAEALSQIAETGRSALTDVGLMLRLLRTDDTPDSPNPTAADIPELVDRFRRAGLTVDPAEVDLGGEPLGAAVDLSIYRVVQEALTNSLKHSRGGPTRLRVADVDDGISIEVRSARGDALSHSAAPAPGAGHGLIGMRERVEMFGGTLHAGPGPDGDFEIRALIPRGVTP